MKINNKLRQDLITYKLNFPVDARTNEFKAQVERFKAPELYKLFLQSKVEQAKIKQRDIDRKAKKEAKKEAKQRKKQLIINRYLGSMFVTLFVVFKPVGKKPSETKYITKTRIIDIKVDKEELNDALKDIENEYVQEVFNESPVLSVDVISRKDDYKIVNNDKIKPLNKIRMKDAGAGLYDGYEPQTWDTNTGKCVFDYIIYRYGNIDGFKKICNYENLCNIFSVQNKYDDDEEITNPLDLLKQGVASCEIKRFCRKFNIPMYAVDEIENIFEQYIPENRNKKCPAMIYRISNKHFYPIIDKLKIQSIVQITSVINNISSDIINNEYKPKKEAKDTLETDIKDNLENVVFVDDINKTLYKMLNMGKIPEKINLNDKDLVSFYIGKTKYIFNKDIEIIKQLCENMKVEYKGQGMGTMLIEIIKEALGKDKEKLSKSCPNPYVYTSLLTARKSRARIGIIDDDYNDTNNLMAWDIIKCYSSCMYKPSEDWIRLDFNDTWEDYDGELKLGLYYLKTDDNTLFKKNGYYSTAIIKKAIYEGINFKITKQLIPSHKEDNDMLTKIIDVVLKYSNGNTKISKTVINLMSGMLGQSSASISKQMKINNDIEQIYNFLNKYYQLEEGIMINKIENTDYYMYGFNKEIKFNETNIPMYIQILDESNIKLYDMIKAMGGKVVAYKVDCVVVMTNNKIDRCDTEWGGYTSCVVPTIKNKEIINDIDFIDDKDWDDNKDLKLNDSDKWEDIHKLLIKNKGLLLQASAGNGKTYTAKMIASKLGKRVKIIAPTNKAGLNIGGGTIHRCLEIDKKGYIKQSTIKAINTKYDYIIVDEISMIGRDLWSRLCLLKQELPHLIFLLLGDEKQIPPVEQNTIKDYFNHPAVKYICNYNKNILNVRKRYDEILYNLLEDVDNIDITKYPKLITDRNICYYNKTRIRINKMWNDKYKKEGDLFLPKPIAKSTDDDDKIKLTQDMYIYENMPIIAMRTKWDKEEGLLFANSETFNICCIENEYIGIFNERPDENGEKEAYNLSIPIEEFNKYFLMNYCSTTHKAQGETITENFTIYDWDAMDTKLRYTALSRAKKIDQVYINH